MQDQPRLCAIVNAVGGQIRERVYWWEKRTWGIADRRNQEESSQRNGYHGTPTPVYDWIKWGLSGIECMVAEMKGQERTSVLYVVSTCDDELARILGNTQREFCADRSGTVACCQLE